MRSQVSILDRKIFLVAYEIDSKLQVAEIGGLDKADARTNFYNKYNRHLKETNQPFKKIKVLSVDEKFNNFCLEMWGFYGFYVDSINYLFHCFNSIYSALTNKRNKLRN